MRKLIFAVALATGALGLSSSAFATMEGHMAAAFGPVYEMPVTAADMKGHKMHLQVIEDDTGAKFVVMPMEEAEMIFGPISASAMHWAGR